MEGEDEAANEAPAPAADGEEEPLDFSKKKKKVRPSSLQPARVHALPSVCRLTHARRAAIPQKKPKDEEAEEGGAAEPASAAADDDDDDAVLDFSKKKKKKPARPRPARALPRAVRPARAAVGVVTRERCRGAVQREEHQTSDIRDQTSDIRHQTSDIRHPPRSGYFNFLLS